MFKLGPKVAKAAGRVALMKGLKKKIKHSDCYCAKLFEANIDESDSNPDKHFPSRDVYKSTLGDYIDTVREEFLNSWDECEENYGDFVNKPNKKKAKEKRKQVLSVCPTIDDFVTNANEVLQSILSKLQKFYNIKGIDVKKKTLGSSGRKSVTEKIGSHKQIDIHFDEDLKDPYAFRS